MKTVTLDVRAPADSMADLTQAWKTGKPQKTARISFATPELLESIDAPVLLMQGNPRQVVTANQKALALFGKELPEVENHRGGQVFNCVHSYTEAGCGKDANCEDCKIKNAIVDTFATDNAHHGVSTELSIRRADGTKTYALQVSTEKVGDFALVRIDRYDPGA